MSSVTLTELLRREAVPIETLQARYGSLLELVRRLIGVVPNCHSYFEIWRPALRTYNVLVPNFLNMPMLMWGMGAPRDIVGLAMYVSSRTAGCAYCSAHSCSFAMRGDAAADKVMAALEAGHPRCTPAESAAMAVARSLSRIPGAIGEGERNALRREFSASDAEWIVLAIGMMGFLNKWMDAMGVELEHATVAEVKGVIASSGWTPGKHGADTVAAGAPPPADGFLTRLSVLRFAPSAIWFDKTWTAGVPDRWPAVGRWLQERTGHDFPLLSRLTHRRAIRAFATMLRDNLDASTSALELPQKVAAGLVYAETVGNASLAAALRRLSPENEEAHPLARAIAPRPAAVDDETLSACGDLSAAAIVELVTFIAILQLWHRLTVFYS